MGLNCDQARAIAFDLETIPMSGAAEYLEPSTAPDNYKDPAKIAAAIQEKDAKKLSGAGLDPDLCEIVAIGWWAEGQEPRVVTREQDSERDLLDGFWLHTAGFRMVGFNCLGFDLPVLLRRSLYLGIVPPAFQLNRYRHPQVTDLMMELTYDGLIDAHKLAFYRKRLALDVPEDPHTGSDIARLYTEGNWPAIAHHVRTDVMVTAQLAARLGYFRLPEAAEVL